MANFATLTTAADKNIFVNKKADAVILKNGILNSRKEGEGEEEKIEKVIIEGRKEFKGKQKKLKEEEVMDEKDNKGKTIIKNGNNESQKNKSMEHSISSSSSFPPSFKILTKPINLLKITKMLHSHFEEYSLGVSNDEEHSSAITLDVPLTAKAQVMLESFCCQCVVCVRFCVSICLNLTLSDLFFFLSMCSIHFSFR